MIRPVLVLLFSVISTFFNAFAQQFVPMLKPCGHHYRSVETTAASPAADALHYLISLEINTAGKWISGFATIDLRAGEETGQTVFDLTTELTVDSVVFDSMTLAFTHNASGLEVTWPHVLSDSEVVQVTVHYHGKPEQDASWGGFIFSGSYAFNLGVGFSSDPHNYGRAWFPCFDNFTDRATYEYKITTAQNELAQCNGSLISRTDMGNGQVVHHWKLRDPIPTYLSSVAVAPYTERIFEHAGIPVRLAALPADSTNMAASFENLPHCMDAFVNRYGPHTFERIGFNLVPFNGGAMEHATNIAYPIFGAKGDKNYEKLWAHELAHHWWGNTVTCSDQSDMWINEGWASYSEKIFLEAVYGRQAYMDEVELNHVNVLRFAHWQDDDTLAVSGVDHARTYGTHVYKKGAEVAHTLRGYMGDSAFFAAIASFMETYKFKDVDSYTLRDHFQDFTQADLTAFFNQWVFNPGNPHFEILSISTVPVMNNGFANSVRIRQRSRFAPQLYTSVPMMITVYSANGDSLNVKGVLNGGETFWEFASGFKPVLAVLDREERISDAVSEDQLWVSETGTLDLKAALMTVTVQSVGANSTLLRVEHNWVIPDHYFKTDVLPALSKERYWKVDGIWQDGFEASARIYYDGRTAGFASGGLDIDLIRKTEDSLVLMYREGPDMKWREYEHYTKVIGSPFDKYGYVTIDQLKKGEYTFAMYHAALLSANGAAPPVEKVDIIPEIVPNPADDTVIFTINDAKGSILEITDASGRLIHSVKVNRQQFIYEYDIRHLPPGVYFAGVSTGNKPYNVSRFIVR